MAEEQSEGGGGNLSGKIKSLLTKKIGGIPAYVFLLAGVLLLAWYLKRRAASKPATTDKSATSGDVTSQTFPYGQPMNYSSDVFVNNQFPPPASNPLVTTAKGGMWLEDFLKQQNAAHPDLNLTAERFKQLNPDLSIKLADRGGYLPAGTSTPRPGSGDAIPVIWTAGPSQQVRIQ